MTRPPLLWCAPLLAAALLCSTLAVPTAHADPIPEEPPTPAATDTPPAAALEASEEAAASGKAVEIVDWTDEYTRTVANPDGTFTVESTREAGRVKEGEGWVPVNTTVSATDDGRLRPEAAVLDVSFSGGGDRALATTTSDGHALTLETPFDLTTPSVEGNTITYPNVMPDVDLVVTVAAESYSHILVVKNRDAAENPDLKALDFAIDTDLSYELQEDGSATASNTDGETVFEASAPLMWDSSSSPQSGDKPSATTTGDAITPVDIESTEKAQARAATTKPAGFTLKPPTEALTGADVEYPVFIDPTWWANSNYFTVVRSGTTSYATGDDLRVGYCNWTGCSPAYVARSYFQFDVSAFNTVAGGTRVKVTKAVVTLTQTHAASSAATPVNLTRTTGSFGPWTAYPGPLGSNISTASTSATGPYEITMDATAYVDSTVYHQIDFVGFGLKASNEADPYQWKKFKNNPKLTITFAYPPSVPQKPVVASDAGLSCGVITSNAVKISTRSKMFGPGTLPTIIYTLAIYKQGGSELAKPLITSGSFSSNVMMTTTQSLPDGKYYVRIKAHPNITDGANFSSAYSEATLFTIDSRQPVDPTVYSPTHPRGSLTFDASGATITSEGANFTDKTGSITLSSTTAAGFLYSWNGTVPTYTNCQAPTSGWVAASNGTATLTPPAPQDGFRTVTLKVKAVTATGHTSKNEVAYTFNTMPKTANVVSVEAESITTSTTHQLVNTAQTSGGKAMQFSTGPGTQTNFTFTPPATPAGSNFWQVQWDLKATTGQKVYYKLNGVQLGNADPNGVTMNPECKFFETIGKNIFDYPKLEPQSCDPNNPSSGPTYYYLPAGQAATFTVFTENNAVISLDKVRFVHQPTVAP